MKRKVGKAGFVVILTCVLIFKEVQALCETNSSWPNFKAPERMNFREKKSVPPVLHLADQLCKLTGLMIYSVGVVEHLRSYVEHSEAKSRQCPVLRFLMIMKTVFGEVEASGLRSCLFECLLAGFFAVYQCQLDQVVASNLLICQ